MNRPSFQFYPSDWRNNSNLRRCSFAARGAWVEILGVLHDSDEYGICRWSLKDLSLASGVPIKLALELVSKFVLKGGDSNVASFIFTPSHAGQQGEPVVLIHATTGPLWYSSRMVRDEYIRQRRGFSTRFESPKVTPKVTPSGSPKRWLGDGPSSSSSSSSSPSRSTTKLPASAFSRTQTDLTARFHSALTIQWENDRQKWMGRIKNFTAKSERVVAEVESAAKENRIKKSPAEYAEQIWKEFK